MRTIDIIAGTGLYDFQEQLRVRPSLNLIIECKQSILPYVFFLSPSKPFILEYPLITGLNSSKILIETDDSLSTWSLGLSSVLGLDNHKFIKEPDYCSTFSKCVRKGSELEITGSEAYNTIVLPLVKAMSHFSFVKSPLATAYYFDAHLTIGLAVIDAPMVGVRVNESNNEIVHLPWVRVPRHEFFENEDYWERSKISVIDLIHKDFLIEYINKHLLPFANFYSKEVVKHQDVLATGKGFAGGMEKFGCYDISGRMQPLKKYQSVRKPKYLLKNIFNFIKNNNSKQSHRG